MSTLDKAIKTCDSADVYQAAKYLWTWEDGNVARDIFNDVLMRVPKNAGLETREEAYAWAKKEALKELDKFYSDLQKKVNEMLKSGYSKNKSGISSVK